MADKPEPMFDVFDLDAFNWSDALEFLQIPHYTNEHEFRDSEPYHYRVRQIDGWEPGVLVLWQHREEPTEEEVRSCLVIDDEDDDEDDDD